MEAVPITADEYRQVLEVVREAIDIPHPATAGDGRVHGDILFMRTMHAMTMVRSILDGESTSPPWSVRYCREQLAKHPATGYRTWDDVKREQQASACADPDCGHGKFSHWEVAEPSGERVGCSRPGCPCETYAPPAPELAAVHGAPLAGGVVADALAAGGFVPAGLLAAGLLSAPPGPGWVCRRCGGLQPGTEPGGVPSVCQDCTAAVPAVPAVGTPPEAGDDGVPDVKVWTRKLSTGVSTYRWVPAAELEAYRADVAADPDRELASDEHEEFVTAFDNGDAVEPFTFTARLVDGGQS